jgi:ubiquinone/menaquinone biosynthesis C-methylase UbiE
MKKLLDIGCGSGTLSNLSYYNKLRNEYTIFGIDFIKKNIQSISKKFPEGNFSVGDAERIKYRKDTFDFILMRHVLEHVYELDNVLKQVNRILKKNGRLLIAVPHPFMESIQKNNIIGYYQSGHHHERVFTEKELTKILKKHKFKIVKISSKKWPLFVLGVALSFSSKFTKKIKMENQTGVFTIGEKSKSKTQHGKYEKVTYKVFEYLDIYLSVMNKIIPFEIEVEAIKK